MAEHKGETVITLTRQPNCGWRIEWLGATEIAPDDPDVVAGVVRNLVALSKKVGQ